MEILKKITEELFGNEFQCLINPKGITLTAKDNSKAFCFGLIDYDDSFIVRENIYAIKSFEEVDAILQPLLTKYDMPQSDFEMAIYNVDFIGTIKKGMPMKDIPGVDAGFIVEGTTINKTDATQIRKVLTQFEKAIAYLEADFMDRYKTIEQVYEAQQQMTPDEGGEFFNTPAPIRYLALASLCNPSAELDSEFEETIKDYQEIEKKYDQFKDHGKATMELHRYFKRELV
ncbi:MULTISPECIES: hypothetical protein [Niastella]|uniref:Uncharacterized protein n=1 Tax=Niastella soli TaxID=2821487 RepID=A0ABS3Z0J0_9BACT|nr:hypothetical protein [Niastella soli]MBO9203684.1 hypothetical protein [Niastella soli]